MVHVYLHYYAQLSQKLLVANRALVIQYSFNTDAHTFTCILNLSHNRTAHPPTCTPNTQTPTENRRPKRWRSTRTVSVLFLHPGVGGAGELVRPVWRPPCGGVEVHVVGVGFESERLTSVAIRGGWGQVDRFVLVLLLSVALWGRQVHSVAVVVLPVGFVVKWLCVLGEEQWCD